MVETEILFTIVTGNFFISDPEMKKSTLLHLSKTPGQSNIKGAYIFWESGISVPIHQGDTGMFQMVFVGHGE